VQARELGVAADRGERGAQLVARVRDEAAHLLLALLARVSAEATWPSMRLNAVPSRPDLGALVVDRTRSASATSPRSRGSFDTRWAVAVTSARGLSAAALRASRARARA
jgi:hypothetical protein